MDKQVDEQERNRADGSPGDAERTRKAAAFEQLVLRIDAATDAIEILRIADAIDVTFGSDLVRRPSAEIRLKALLVERLDRRTRATLSPPDPELSDPRVVAAGERCFWDEAYLRIAAVFAVGCTIGGMVQISKDAARMADALLVERRARRAPSSAP